MVNGNRSQTHTHTHTNVYGFTIEFYFYIIECVVRITAYMSCVWVRSMVSIR